MLLMPLMLPIRHYAIFFHYAIDAAILLPLPDYFFRFRLMPLFRQPLLPPFRPPIFSPLLTFAAISLPLMPMASITPFRAADYYAIAIRFTLLITPLFII
jgi:hypothetical protein